jgi:hypothetical protein
MKKNWLYLCESTISFQTINLISCVLGDPPKIKCLCYVIQVSQQFLTPMVAPNLSPVLRVLRYSQTNSSLMMIGFLP